MNRLAIALLVSVSLGCTASLQEVRQRAPIYTGDFPRPYQAITRCIFDRLNAQTGSSLWSGLSAAGGLSSFLYRLDDQPELRRARVDAMSVGGPPSAEFEITVEPTAAGVSHVEYRRRWGGFDSTDMAAWTVVTGCGQPQARGATPAG